MIFSIFSPKKSAEKMAFLTQNKAKLCKKFYHNIVFWEKRQFFRRNWAKIAENCDYNIDPRSASKIKVILNCFTQLVNPKFSFSNICGHGAACCDREVVCSFTTSYGQSD
jgi:hypothetical protein